MDLHDIPLQTLNLALPVVDSNGRNLPRKQVYLAPLHHLFEQLAIAILDEGDATPGSTCPRSPANPMQVRGEVPRGVKVDDRLDTKDVEATCRDVRGKQEPGLSRAKIFQTPKPSSLRHISVELDGHRQLGQAEQDLGPVGLLLGREEDDNSARVLERSGYHREESRLFFQGSFPLESENLLGERLGRCSRLVRCQPHGVPQRQIDQVLHLLGHRR
mmetsp:Transcript_11938/g.33656  ORF Transcript_11938/g.33656 Transcript_11938/m.33656 type:complete len:216 (+) Transcript_11938:2331-2978(+)